VSAPLPAHLRHLGLARNPFPPTPDAAAYFRTARLDQQLAEVAHCISAGKGFVLLTGEVGTGKSTFLRRLLADLDDDADAQVAVAMVFNTFLQGGELLAAILRDFGLVPCGKLSADLDALNRFLIERHRDGVACVLVIDDAQNLDLESLELLRLLSNLETSQHKLLQLVLAGQLELIELLARHEIRQLASRIVTHVRMQPLSRSELDAYVRHRLGHAGDEGTVALSSPALHRLHSASGGNPRRVHLLLDRCLYGLVLQPMRRIDLRLLRTADAELGDLRARRRWPRATAPLAALVVIGATMLAAMQLPGAPSATAAATTVAPSAVVSAAAERSPAAIAREAGAAAELAATSTADAAGNASAATASGSKGASDGGFADCLSRHAGEPLQFARLPAAATLSLEHARCRSDDVSGTTVAWLPVLDPRHFVAGQPRVDVERVQQLLAANGVYPGAIDGDFGWRSQHGLRRLQARHGLPVSGLPDPPTLFLLDAILAVAEPATAPSTAPAPLQDPAAGTPRDDDGEHDADA
jgi:general secretion pathway protein A